MKNQKAFGIKIRNARMQGGLTIDFAAELSDVSISTWKQYERGERLPSLSKFVSVCTTLKVTPEFLLSDELSDLSNVLNIKENLKLKLDQLSSDDIEVLDVAVTRRLELNKLI